MKPDQLDIDQELETVAGETQHLVTEVFRDGYNLGFQDGYKEAQAEYDAMAEFDNEWEKKNGY